MQRVENGSIGGWFDVWMDRPGGDGGWGGGGCRFWGVQEQLKMMSIFLGPQNRFLSPCLT